MKTPEEYVQQLKNAPKQASFDELMEIIGRYYDYQPCAFRNGSGEDTVSNQAGENEGSCRLFAFARLHALDKDLTLHCFGHYYREDVLKHPDANDHANIRRFMQHGWDGICFEGNALRRKQKR